MKRHRKLISMALAIIIMSALLATTALGASTVVALSASSVKAGGTLNVTVTFRGDGSTVGSVMAHVNYDPAVIQFVSGDSAAGGNGTVTIVGFTMSSVNSLSYKLSFKALAAGSSGITVSVAEMYSFDGAALTCTSAGATVTVTAGSSGGGGGGSGGSGGSVQPPPAQEEIPTQVKVGQETLYLWKGLSGVELPDEYEKTEIEYGEKTVAAAKGVGQSTVLLYLTDKDRENGAFYIYEQTTAELYPYCELASAYCHYTLLKLPQGVFPPEGWSAARLELSGRTLDAYRSDNADYNGFYLVYAVSAQGRTGFFLYDSVEGAMQRFVEITPEIVQEPEEPEELPEEPAPLPKTLWERITADRQIFMIMLLLAALAGGLLIVNLAAAVVKWFSKQSVKRRNKKNDRLRKRAEKINAMSKHKQRPGERAPADKHASQEKQEKDSAANSDTKSADKKTPEPTPENPPEK